MRGAARAADDADADAGVALDGAVGRLLAAEGVVSDAAGGRSRRGAVVGARLADGGASRPPRAGVAAARAFAWCVVPRACAMRALCASSVACRSSSGGSSVDVRRRDPLRGGCAGGGGGAFELDGPAADAAAARDFTRCCAACDAACAIRALCASSAACRSSIFAGSSVDDRRRARRAAADLAFGAGLFGAGLLGGGGTPASAANASASRLTGSGSEPSGGKWSGCSRSKNVSSRSIGLPASRSYHSSGASKGCESVKSPSYSSSSPPSIFSNARARASARRRGALQIDPPRRAGARDSQMSPRLRRRRRPAAARQKLAT